MGDLELIEIAKGLKEKCYACKKCELGHNFLDDYDPHVFAVGNLCANIVFIAEAPGYHESVIRKPLVGRSGKLFDEKILKYLGLEREDVWITNTVLCRPPDNRKPTANERNICSEHLVAQLELIKPKIIVSMGATPMATLLDIDGGITKLAGNVYFSKKYNYNVFVLLHPSFFLRTHKYDLLEDHLSKLKQYLQNV